MDATTKEWGPITPERGMYLVDTRTVDLGGRSSPAWVGRVQLVLGGGRVLLITHTGYEWAVGPGDVREATAVERDGYEAALARWDRSITQAPGVRRP